ncbi:MAG: class I SAM-dependent methyltransferase [Alphaproteobacteria bacterium]|nr:class I SAM-dependent methyltransferase [Alphaproteobacteria bacterium]
MDQLEDEPPPVSGAGSTGVAQPVPFSGESITIPDYLRDVYHWAYLSRVGRAVFDHPFVVHAILWGNMHRLTQAAIDELLPGQNVLQPACVYGNFSPCLARAIGPDGSLTVTDVAPIQVAGCRRKLVDMPQATVRLGDAARPTGGPYDAVVCFFLLHEVPETYKTAIVNSLLDIITPTGKVVFVDYNRPSPYHPLKGIMSLIFDSLEPFAKDLWRREIESYARDAAAFTWSKSTYFGGLYQKIVVRRVAA